MAGSNGGGGGGGGRVSVDIGILIIRIGIGIIFVCHGWPKLTGGPDMWQKVGEMGMQPLGVTFALPVWGFLASVAECVGGMALIAGFFVRPAALLMLITMFVATFIMIKAGAPFDPSQAHNVPSWSHPAAMGAVFLGLLVTGAGGLDVLQLVKALKQK